MTHKMRGLSLALVLLTATAQAAQPPAKKALTASTLLGASSATPFFAALTDLRAELGASSKSGIKGNADPFSPDPLAPLRLVVEQSGRSADANQICQDAGFASFGDWLEFGNRLANTVARVSLGRGIQDLEDILASTTDETSKHNLEGLLALTRDRLTTIPSQAPVASERTFVETNLTRIERAFAGQPF